MDYHINQLKASLVEANSDERKIELKGKIEEIKDIAESEVRRHQREVDFDSKEMTVELVVSKYMDKLDIEENELFVPDYQEILFGRLKIKVD